MDENDEEVIKKRSELLENIDLYTSLQRLKNRSIQVNIHQEISKITISDFKDYEESTNITELQNLEKLVSISKSTCSQDKYADKEYIQENIEQILDLINYQFIYDSVKFEDTSLRNLYLNALMFAEIERIEDPDIFYSLIKDNNVTSEVLDYLSRLDDIEIRRLVSNNTSCCGGTLFFMALEDDQEIRVNIALNPSSPLEALVWLVLDPDSEIRCAVANNPYTPSELLEYLANDNDKDVRKCVAEHLNTNFFTLSKLSKDKEIEVRQCVKYNPNTPSNINISIKKKNENKINIDTSIDNPYLQNENNADTEEETISANKSLDKFKKEINGNKKEIFIPLALDEYIPPKILLYLMDIDKKINEQKIDLNNLGNEKKVSNEFGIREFDSNGINRITGTKYDLNGYDQYWFDFNGYDWRGYDKEGYDKEGYDKFNFDREGINKYTGNKIDIYNHTIEFYIHGKI